MSDGTDDTLPGAKPGASPPAKPPGIAPTLPGGAQKPPGPAPTLPTAAQKPPGAEDTLPPQAARPGTEDTLPPEAVRPGTEDTIPPEAARPGTEATLPGDATRPGTRRAKAGDVARPTRPADASAGVTLADTLRDASLDRLRPVGRDSYLVLGEMARGGLGRISRARDLRTGRPVAIKEVLRPGEEIVVRFAREALVTANLQHPSIVPVYEVGRWPGGEPFYAMKLVKGRSLEDVVAETTTAAARVALLPHVIDVADALAYAHGERIIHRDLKPANVLVGAYGETVVIDWGLAKNLATGEELAALPAVPGRAPATTPAAQTTSGGSGGETVAGAVLGTPAYMPPEQARGEIVDERADVYALGAILYHVLAGVRPYAEARTAMEILDKVQVGPPRALAELAPDLPEELLTITAKAMASNAAARYPSAQGLAEDLRRFQAGQLVGAHRYTARELFRRWLKKYRGVVATAAVAAAALAVFGAYSFHRIAGERDEASRQRAVAVRERTAADAARAVAERRLSEGLEELGRQALLAGAPDRALPLLAGARVARPEGSPVLTLLTGRAQAPYRDLTLVAPSGATTFSTDISSDGKWLLTAESSGALTVWSGAGGPARWSRLNVYRAALSPTDRWIAAAEFSGRVSFYALESGARGASHEVKALPVTVMAWSPDGSRIALADRGGVVVALDLERGDTAVTATLHKGQVRALAWSPDGALLASAGDDGTIALSDPATLAVTRRIEAHAGGAGALLWRDDRLVSGGGDGEAAVWDPSTGRGMARMKHHPGESLYAVAVDPSGRLLVTAATDGTAKLWDLETGAARGELPGHAFGVNGVVFVGDRVVTSDETGVLRLWDAERAELLRVFPADGTVWALAARAGRVAVSSSGARVRVWEAPRPELARLRMQGRTRRLRFDAAGRVLYTSANDGTARAFDALTGAPIWVAGEVHAAPADVADGPATGARAMELSPDGKLLVVGYEDGRVIAWDTARGVEAARWAGHTARVRTVLFDPGGKIAYTASSDGTARRWDVATGAETGRIDAGGPLEAVALPTADRLVTRTDAGAFAIHDAATLRRLDDGTLYPTRLTQIVTLPDGTFIGGQPGALILFDPKSASARGQISAGMPFAVETSADGKTLVSSGSAGDLTVFDVATGTPLRSWKGDKELTATLRLSPHGDLLATSGKDLDVKLWDVATGRLLAQTPHYAGIVTQLVWSPDGRRLAIGGLSPDVWLWDLSGGDDPAPALTRLSDCATPWKLDGSRLVLAPINGPACGPADLLTR